MTRAIPSYHALRAFEAAARLGSFVRASHELHISASAISHQVRRLEDHFGRKLFEPGTQSKRLTDDGARLAAGLADAFDAMENACAEVTPRATASTLTVHCAPSFAAKWLAPRLPSFMERYPTVSIRLSSGAGSYDLVRHEATDVAIVYGDMLASPGITLESLGEEEISAFCTPTVAATLQAARRSAMTLPLIESSVSPVRWSDWFAVNGLGRHPPLPATSFDRGALVVSAAVQGVGVALESERFVEAELASGQLVALGGTRFRSIRRVLHNLVIRAGAQPPHRVRVFRSWLLAEVSVARHDMA